ncbi:hypothetical protein BH18ACT14_BH18ACT14_18680 [soil metagenome]
MDARAKTVARNESLFREVNERIEEIAETKFKSSHSEFFCECDDADCVELMELTVEEYEEIRFDPMRFVVKPGHELPDFERVFERESHYVVEKIGDAGEVAERLDPRS